MGVGHRRAAQHQRQLGILQMMKITLEMGFIQFCE
jgi:hypothetical protein